MPSFKLGDSISTSNEALPVVTGDLLHHASGCYSAHSGVKRWNRLAENRLIMAEKISVMGRAFSQHQNTHRDGKIATLADPPARRGRVWNPDFSW